MARKSTRQNREQVSRSEELDKRRDERLNKYLALEECDIEDDTVAAVENALRASAYLMNFSAVSGVHLGSADMFMFAKILSVAARKVSWIATNPERYFENATFRK